MFEQKSLVEELVGYIKKNLKKGYTKESLRWALVDQGYSKIQVENAMKRAEKELADAAPILKTRPEIRREHAEVQPEPETKKGFFGFFKR